jgi:hypothetical protein
MFCLFLAVFAKAIAAPPISSVEDAISRSVGTPYTVSAVEAELLKTTSKYCGIKDTGSTCLFAVAPTGVAELAYEVNSASVDTVARISTVSPLATSAASLNCASPRVECTLRAGFKTLDDGKQVLHVLIQAFKPGTGVSLGHSLWLIPERTGLMYQLP